MNDGDPSSPALWLDAMRLLAFWGAAMLLAGGVSALTTVLRMWRHGLIGNEGTPVPGQRLLERARPVLLTFSVGFLIAASLAAAEMPRLLAETGGSPWWVGLGWVLYLLFFVAGAVGAKALALARPMGYLRSITPLAWVLHVVFSPLTAPLALLMNRLVPALWNLDLSPPLSGSEIRGLLADEEASSHMQTEELTWARSIFELGGTEIREIMVPRIDMVALDVRTPLDEAVAFAAEAHFTRLPVYEESPDRILGVLHTKDLLRVVVRGDKPSLRELLRPVHFLPESKPIDEALAEFRESRIHLAVVVDEYGGTAGIVTLEDILEEIVGEIRDEFDQEGELVRVLDSQHVVIDPRIDLDDLNEMLSLELPTEESDTLAGLLYQLCGKVPQRGDSVDFEGLHFTIDRVERQRIRQVTLTADEPLPLGSGRNGGQEN